MIRTLASLYSLPQLFWRTDKALDQGRTGWTRWSLFFRRLVCLGRSLVKCTAILHGPLPTVSILLFETWGPQGRFRSANQGCQFVRLDEKFLLKAFKIRKMLIFLRFLACLVGFLRQNYWRFIDFIDVFMHCLNKNNQNSDVLTMPALKTSSLLQQFHPIEKKTYLRHTTLLH